MKHPPRQFLAYCKAVATALILGSVVYVLDTAVIAGSAQHIKLAWMVAALSLVVPLVFVQWAKWHQLLRSRISDCSLGTSLHSLFVGFALGMVSPGRLGEVGRGGLMERARFEVSVLAAVDRTVSFAVTLLLGSLSAVVVFPQVGAVAVAIWGAGVAAIWYLRSTVVELLNRSGWGRRSVEIVRCVPRGLWVRVASLSLLFNLIFCAQFILLLRSWGPVEPNAVWATPLIFGLKSLLPLALMDLGVREGAAVFVFSMLELEPVHAFGAALALFVMNVLLPGIVGGVLIMHRFLPAYRIAGVGRRGIPSV